MKKKSIEIETIRKLLVFCLSIGVLRPIDSQGNLEPCVKGYTKKEKGKEKERSSKNGKDKDPNLLHQRVYIMTDQDIASENNTEVDISKTPYVT